VKVLVEKDLGRFDDEPELEPGRLDRAIEKGLEPEVGLAGNRECESQRRPPS
jgi:hypothetical protein